MKRNMTSDWTKSPFALHRDLILANHGTAIKLRSIVKSLYAGEGAEVDLSCIAMFDEKHYDIFKELVEYFHYNGENDEEFMRLGRDIYKIEEAKKPGVK